MTCAYCAQETRLQLCIKLQFNAVAFMCHGQVSTSSLNFTSYYMHPTMRGAHVPVGRVKGFKE